MAEIERQAAGGCLAVILSECGREAEYAWGVDTVAHCDPFSRYVARRSVWAGGCRGALHHRRNASLHDVRFGLAQSLPHLHDGPHLQALVSVAHLQVGVQLQGLHLQFAVIAVLHSFGL